jgi:hypothetical protein
MSVSPPRDHLRSFYPDFEPKFQIAAIKAVVELHKDDSAGRNKSLEALIAATHEHTDFDDRQRAEREAGDLFQETGYAEAAYSMGAVGMLAPFLETIFHQAFLAMGRKLYSEAAPPPSHERWTMPNAKNGIADTFLRRESRRKTL